MKIGDTRLGSMETGTGLVRAAIEIVRHKCDVANMSYGEASAMPDFGRFIELLKTNVINETGCVFVSSAGNNGPALTTVGAPGGATSPVISVGAYVTKGMMDAEYAMLKKVKERPFTWSSRGPTSDGEEGVDIYAPGAAITSVPQCMIQRTQLMNGTSMSSPNCCGCISLLISGMKQSDVPYTPYLIRQAIQFSAKSIDDPQGVGLIQVENAFKHISETVKDDLAHTLQYDVTVNKDMRGVYLRDLAECETTQQFSVNVSPVYPKMKDSRQNASKLTLDIQACLETSHDWIEAPDFAMINNGGRGFSIRVDPSHLKPGLHVGHVLGYDSENKHLGPIFKIPVTVCKPDLNAISSSYINYEDIDFSPGDIKRYFIHVPAGSNFVGLY